MKRITVFAIVALVAVSLVNCDLVSLPPAKTNTSSLVEEAAIRSVVENFGKRLQAVSLQSPSASKEMKEQYSNFASPSMLETWMGDVSKAPGVWFQAPGLIE